MSEKPIIFSGPMVRAILDGRKSQTRRIVKEQPTTDLPVESLSVEGRGVGLCEGRVITQYCPYGQPGDRLYVRETTIENVIGSESMTIYPADGWAPRIRWNYSRPTRPAIHLPKKLARLWLEVTSVRVERLQDITEDDAIAEGVDAVSQDDVRRSATWSRRQDFAQLWDSLNAKRGYGWESNPWVWVIEFSNADQA